MLNAVIDLSHYNTISNFEDMQADGILGIIHKATEGTGFKDSKYSNRKEMWLSQMGMLWGAYHFANNANPIAQADFFLNTVQPDSNTLLVLDFERNGSNSMSLEQAKTFITHVQQQTGKYPGLYSGEYIKSMLGNNEDDVLKQCWLWISQYSTTVSIPPNWDKWTLWQYTGDGEGPEPHTVNGVNGNVDRNKFDGTEDELKTFWQENSIA